MWLLLREGAAVSLIARVWNATATLLRSLDKHVSVRVGHFGDGHRLPRSPWPSMPNHAGAAPGSPVGTTLVQTHLEELEVRPTSFRGGEFLGFTSRPITSPIDHNHLQLVVTVGEQAGHHAPGTVTREAGLLSLLRHPQVLQQTAFPPVVSL